jgi:GMP reductase
MEDVIDVRIAKLFSSLGMFYVFHRFNPELNPYKFAKLANEEGWKLVSISVGVENESVNQLEMILAEGLRVDFICIDVAHGYHEKVVRMVEYIKKVFPSSTKVIAGNVASGKAALRLEESGADAVKAGIGGGRICTTKFQTGFHVPMFSCIRDIRGYSSVPIIADGGIKYYGDVAKALVSGAKMVMCGGIFASCVDSPAKSIAGLKEYRGSTSLAAKKTNKHIEGITLALEPDVTILERIREMKEALQSSISYGGGHDLSCFAFVEYQESA